MKIRFVAGLLAAAAVLGPGAAGAAGGPVLLIRSVRAVDVRAHTVVFPVHEGSSHGMTVWYILTDVSDAAAAKAQGLVFAPALSGVGVAMSVGENGGVWNFPAVPDFAPVRRFEAGPAGFPPAAAQPGAVAGEAYSPFVKLAGSPIVYNAPIVATGDAPFDVATHNDTGDRVLALDPVRGTVTLLLADGFAGGKRVFYISTEASDAGVATVERATFAPGLANAPVSARLPIYALVNGREQGLAFAALSGNLSASATAANAATLETSRNVLAGLPVADDGGGSYDPLWDAYVGAWSASAVAAGQNAVLRDGGAVTAAAAAGRLSAPDGKPFGRAGVAVNCPVVAIER